MTPTTLTGLVPTTAADLESVIETRRGMRGIWQHGLWMPLPIQGGDDGDSDGGGDPPTGDASGTGDNEEPKTFSLEYVQKLRRENGDLRTANKTITGELDTAKGKLKEIDDANLSETERLKQELEQANARAETAEKSSKARILKAAVIVEAANLKFHDPEDGFRYIDQSAIQYNEAGDATNIKALLEDLVKTKAYLVKGDNGGGAGPSRTPDGGKPNSHEALVASSKKEMQESGRYSSLI